LDNTTKSDTAVIPADPKISAGAPTTQVPKPHPQNAEYRQRELDKIHARLRAAISAISMKSPSWIRAVLDSYLPCTPPSRAYQGASILPKTVHSNFAHPNRSSCDETHESLLYFHVGDAILAYHAAVRDSFLNLPTQEIALLERIASQGLDKFKVWGTMLGGFYLKEITR
jgi:hypothetical protein